MNFDELAGLSPAEFDAVMSSPQDGDEVELVAELGRKRCGVPLGTRGVVQRLRLDRCDGRRVARLDITWAMGWETVEPPEAVRKVGVGGRVG